MINNIFSLKICFSIDRTNLIWYRANRSVLILGRFFKKLISGNATLQLLWPVFAMPDLFCFFASSAFKLMSCKFFKLKISTLNLLEWQNSFMSKSGSNIPNNVKVYFAKIITFSEEKYRLHCLKMLMCLVGEILENLTFPTKAFVQHSSYFKHAFQLDHE